MLDDDPRLRAAGLLPPEREAESRPLLHRLAVFPLPRKRVGTGLDRELTVHAHRRRGVLHHPQLGEAGKKVLSDEGKRRQRAKKEKGRERDRQAGRQAGRQTRKRREGGQPRYGGGGIGGSVAGGRAPQTCFGHHRRTSPT